MIEIPESVTLRQQIDDRFVGHNVISAEAGHSPHGFAFYNHTPEEYATLLEGKELTEVRSSGGLVELIFEDMHLALNDGVNIRYLAPEAAVPKKHQFLLRFDDDSALVCTLQMYGGFYLYPQGKSDNFYYLVSIEKPSPLCDEFDKPYFDSLRDGVDAKLSLKAFLATEQRIPGLGNGVLQDILFNAGLNPQKKLRDTSDSEFHTLFDSVKTTLRQMTDQGGRDTDKDLYGKPGGYRTILSNKTKGEPCPQCGGEIVRKAYLGGNVYFCPVDQPL